MTVPDETLPLPARPYGLLSARARHLDADVYDTRILLRRAPHLGGCAGAHCS
ncbi:hypothetical protein [Actinomadura bangladeshensis]|uniref:hypothetical protein n=1 Tax=Actinomadura bangladeshensis TaxID=453573 RepID=UPI001FB6D18D|nr:hypothetical protein [Actinomadura bangladeshensis]